MSTNKSAIAQEGSISVPIAASEDKIMITATFVITQSWIFLPMQLIYGAKTNMSLLKFKFSKICSLSVTLVIQTSQQNF